MQKRITCVSPDPSFEALITDFEEVDLGIGFHLLSGLRKGQLRTVREFRVAIGAWCRSAEAREQHPTDILDGVAYAAETMPEDILGFLVRDLIEECLARQAPSAA